MHAGTPLERGLQHDGGRQCQELVGLPDYHYARMHSSTFTISCWSNDSRVIRVSYEGEESIKLP